jgi:hypothetical protein
VQRTNEAELLFISKYSKCVDYHAFYISSLNFTCVSDIFTVSVISVLIKKAVRTFEVVLGGLVVSVLAIGPKVRGYKPGRGRWIFQADKNPQHTFLRMGSKAGGRMS